NELQVVAGDDLSETTLTKAIKLLQEPKEDKSAKPKDKATVPSDQPETQSGSDASPSASTNGQATGEGTTNTQEAQEAEKGINVPPPHDQPDKDRLAAVYAQNGPASTPIQLMTNIVIPNLKKVSEVGVSDNDVPFLANAIKEALALIEALKL